jgi:hypothetical protein
LQATANGFEIGPCAKELEVPNDAELAFVSPACVHSNIVSFCGGVKGVKGWRSFSKEDSKTVRTGSRCSEEMSDAAPDLIAAATSGQLTWRSAVHAEKRQEQLSIG